MYNFIIIIVLLYNIMNLYTNCIFKGGEQTRNFTINITRNFTINNKN